jgi:hypothetical protein
MCSFLFTSFPIITIVIIIIIIIIIIIEFNLLELYWFIITIILLSF